MEDFLTKARELAYGEIDRTGLPLRVHLDLSVDTAKRLARELGVNVDIVEAGALLMDCALGQAMKEGKQGEHVKMSADKANELLTQSSLLEEEKENIHTAYWNITVWLSFTLKNQKFVAMLIATDLPQSKAWV